MKWTNTSLLFLCLLSSLSPASAEEEHTIQLRLDAGLSYHSIRYFENILQPITPWGDFQWGEVVALSVGKQVDENQFIATQLDWQNLGDHNLLALRAFEYNYLISDSWSTHAFIGAARYDYRTPAYGYTAGLGIRIKSWPSKQFGLTIEAQYHDKLARDKLTAQDPSRIETGDDMFFDIRAINVSFNYYF